MYGDVFYGTANVKCDVMLDILVEPRIPFSSLFASL